jgi:hypothetical protein
MEVPPILNLPNDEDLLWINPEEEFSTLWSAVFRYRYE